MFLDWQFRLVFFLLKVFGLLIFEYPSKIFNRTKFGILMFSLNVALFLYLFTNILFSRKYDFVKKFNVVHTVSMLLTISMFTTRIITISLFFVFNREIFNLFNKIKKFDSILRCIQVEAKHENILPSVIFVVRILSTIYIFGKKPLSILAIVSLYTPVDLYFLIVILLMQRLDEIEYFMR
jgi:hypothetical protein